MKIAFCGASGSGKTTLARKVAAELGFNYTENSAGLIMLPEDKQYLKKKYGYEGNWGQLGVIKASEKNPQFGEEFQMAVLRARRALTEREGNWVFDRSAIDPMAYYLNQVAHHTGQAMTDVFMRECVEVLKGYDMIIYLPLITSDDKVRTIENNGSRIDNWFFQLKIDGLMNSCIEWAKEILGDDDADNMSPVAFRQVYYWDMESRFSLTMSMIQSFISSYQNFKKLYVKANPIPEV